MIGYFENMTPVPGPGRVSTETLWLMPAQRDAWLLIPAVVMWFVIQHAVGPALGAMFFGKKYNNLKRKDKDDWKVRFASLVNGLMCCRAAYFFFFVATNNKGYSCDVYATKPEYNISQILIVSYFIWDVITSVYFDWGPLFIGHAIFSLLGTYLLMYPVADEFSGHFTGTFEISNIFIHGAEMLAHTKTAPGLQHIMKLIFALLFTVVRVGGGSFVAYSFTMCAIPLVQSGTAHSDFAIIACCVIIWTLQCLQYLWFKTIVKTALGME